MDRNSAYLLVDILKEINSLKILLNRKHFLLIKSLLNIGDLLYDMTNGALKTSDEEDFTLHLTKISKSLENIKDNKEMEITRIDFNTLYNSIESIAKKIAELQQQLKS